MPYTQRKLKVSSTKGISFVLNNYYQFSFTTKVVGSKLTTVIRSQLHNSVHQRRIMDFPFTVKSNERPDYSVKLGVTTSVRPKFSDLDRITKCFRAYEATDPSDPDWGSFWTRLWRFSNGVVLKVLVINDGFLKKPYHVLLSCDRSETSLALNLTCTFVRKMGLITPYVVASQNLTTWSFLLLYCLQRLSSANPISVWLRTGSSGHVDP